MSISLMTAAWKSSYPSGEKLVLLALCDNANDQGECYPSTSMLAEKCSISERSVFNHLETLTKTGAITKKNRSGRSTIYYIDPCKFCTPANSAPLQPLHTTPATVAPPPLQPLHTTPATVAPITISEPSSEPSVNQNTKRKAFDAQAHLESLGVDPEVSADWLTLRKSKKSPVTKTAIAGIESEALKAGLSLEIALREGCSRGWTGFKAAWLENSQQARAGPAYKTVGQDRAECIAALTGRTKPQEIAIEGGFVRVA